MQDLVFVDKALYFIQKARVQAQVRESHLKRNESEDPLTTEIKKRVYDLEKWLNSKVAEVVRAHPCYGWFSQIKGIGDLNIGKVICLIDIEKCQTISKLWRYALGAPIGEDGNKHVEKRTKGEPIHYNQMLKVMCWRLGQSFIKANNKYADYYRAEKEKIVQKLADKGIQVVPAANLPTEDGKKVEKDGKFSLGHVDRMAFRKMMKLFLSHLWLKWREAEGLPISQPYVIAKGGHEHIITAEEMVDD